eukprot:TCONS_00019685-protein
MRIIPATLYDCGNEVFTEQQTGQSFCKMKTQFIVCVSFCLVISVTGIALKRQCIPCSDYNQNPYPQQCYSCPLCYVCTQPDGSNALIPTPTPPTTPPSPPPPSPTVLSGETTQANLAFTTTTTASSSS